MTTNAEQDAAYWQCEWEKASNQAQSFRQLLAQQQASHRVRENQLYRATQIATQHVGKLKSVGYKLDAVRQELTARAEKAEAERESLAAVVEIVAQSGGQTVSDELATAALRALGRAT